MERQWRSESPNGSRLSCGRSARRRKGSGRTSRARQGTTQRLSFRTRAPASFKRLLGRLRKNRQSFGLRVVHAQDLGPYGLLADAVPSQHLPWPSRLVAEECKEEMFATVMLRAECAGL